MGRFVFNPDYRYDDPGEYRAGQTLTDGWGREWMMVKASSAISKHSAVRVNENYNAAPSGKSDANLYQPVGVASEAFNSGQFGWVQLTGTAVVRTVSGATASVDVRTSGTAGALSAAGSGQNKINNIRITGARDGTTNTNPVFLFRPVVYEA